MKKNEASAQLMNMLVQYVARLKFISQIERNLIQAQAGAKDLDLASLFDGRASFKPQNTIRFIEKALKAQRGLSKLEKDVADRLLTNEFSELYLTTMIAYYISVHYATEKKYREALTLGQHAIQEVDHCFEFANKSFNQQSSPRAQIA